MSLRISFERHGGIAGIPLRWQVDVEQLPPADARKLAELVEQARFFELPQVLRAAEEGADRFGYVIEIERHGSHHRVEASEEAQPEALQRLVEFLVREAKNARRRAGRS